MNRPSPFEELLAEALQGERHARGPGCPDPEGIAAFRGGELSSEERVGIENHLAGCEPCQRELASLARVGDPGREQTRLGGWLSGWRTAWLPVAAVATAAVVITLRLAPEAERALRVPAPRAPEAPVLFEKKPAVAPREADEARAAAPAPARKPAAFEAKGLAAEERVDFERSAKSLDQPAERSEPRSSAFTSLAPVEKETTEGADLRDAAGASGALQEAVGGSRRQLRSQPSAEALRSPIIRSPAGSLWRVSDRRIERSDDGGNAWTRVAEWPGGRLVAGSAPSDEIVWLLGSDGLILRTSDGASWARVPPPAAAELTSVAAESAVDANVRSADGRTYHTSDGGHTWR